MSQKIVNQKCIYFQISHYEKLIFEKFSRLRHGVNAHRYWEAGESDRDFRYNNYLSRYHWRHIDLMDVLSGYGASGRASLDLAAQLVGLPGKLGIGGAEVWPAYRRGELAAIREYCETDVLNTYLIYLRFQLVRGELDAIVPLDVPLDVLAQQVVAEASCRDWLEDDLYARVRRAWPYRALARSDFDAVIRMLAEGFTTRRGRRGGLVHRDEVARRVVAKRSARVTALTSGGAIPDVADYRVVLAPDDTFLGTLNEYFAIESNAVHFDALHLNRFCTGYNRRDFSLHLSEGQQYESCRQ